VTFLALLLLLPLCSCNAPEREPASAVPASPDAPKPLPRTRLVFPNERAIEVEMALTPEDQERGLMLRTRLDPDYGILYAFPQERVLKFWMKDTLVDLDMVFLDKDKRITVIHRDVPRAETAAPDSRIARRTGLGRYVLTLPAGAAGWNKLEVGQKLRFDAPEPR